MNQETFAKLFHETMKSMEQLLIVKGGEYAGSADSLGNFKRGADLVSVTPLQCAFIYASKHYDAIATFVRDDATGTVRPRSEAIEGRLDDLMNYCLLMKALIREKKPAPTPAEYMERTPIYVRFKDGGQEKVRDPELYHLAISDPGPGMSIAWMGRQITGVSFDSGVTWKAR